MTANYRIVARKSKVLSTIPLFISDGSSDAVARYRTFNIEHAVVETPFTGVIGGVICRRAKDKNGDKLGNEIDEGSICSIWTSWKAAQTGTKFTETWASLDIEYLRSALDPFLPGRTPSIPKLRILDSVEFGQKR
jgi:hypothetical protein